MQLCLHELDACVTIVHQAHSRDTGSLDPGIVRMLVFSRRIWFSWLYTEDNRCEILNVLVSVKLAFWRFIMEC